MHEWHNGGGWGAGEWVAMALMMLVIWGAVAALIVTLVRRPHLSHDITLARGTHDNAERILGERFARGEIDEEEFARRRDALRRSQ
jgi:putative membrane protein